MPRPAEPDQTPEAPSPDDLTLTGSDRDADVGAAKGQMPLFSLAEGGTGADAASPAVPGNLADATSNERIGVLSNLKQFDPVAHESVQRMIERMPSGERRRLRRQLKKHQGTPWAVSAVKGLVLRDAMTTLFDGGDASDVLSARMWGDKANFANGQIFRAFKAGPDAVRAMATVYNFVSGNRKAEQDYSGSFANCNPSKLCASECYAAKGTAYTNSLVKVEFTEFVAERMPDVLADRIAAQYEASAPGMAGLALRTNEKGDLSEAQLNVIKRLNDRGVRIQIFSKRPDLLRKADDSNLRMLSVDESNIDLAHDNPDLQLSVILTDGLDAGDLADVNDRVAVYLPIKTRDKVLWDGRGLREKFGEFFTRMRNKVCPVDSGKLSIGGKGASFVSIGTKAGKGKWTCTGCDKFGAHGCFNGDRQTEKAIIHLDNLRNRSKQKSVDDIRTSLDKLVQIGELDGRTAESILEGLSGAMQRAGRPADAGAEATGAEGGNRAGQGLRGRDAQDRRGRVQQSLSGEPESRQTVDALRDGLTGRIGKAAAALEKSGKLRIVQSVDDLPANTGGEILAARFDNLETAERAAERIGASAEYDFWSGKFALSMPAKHPDNVGGMYDGQTAYLVADNIAPGNELGVLLHEVGEHAGMKAMLGDKYADLTGQFKRLLDSGDESAVRADARARRSGVSGEVLDQERLAYLIEDVANNNARGKHSGRVQELVRRALAALKAWAYSHPAVRRFLGDKYADLTGQFKRLLDSGDESAVRADARARRSGVSGEVLDQERLAYLIEDVANNNARGKHSGRVQELVRRALAALKAWAYSHPAVRRFLGDIKLTPRDFVALAKRSVERQARGSSATETDSPQFSADSEGGRDAARADVVEQARRAMNRVIADQADAPAAFERDELGPVSLYWGQQGDPSRDFSGGWGVSHIIARRNAEGMDGEAVARRMVETIVRGDIGSPYGPPGGERVNVRLGSAEAVLSKFKDGQQETWLLTGWDDGLSDGAGGVNPARTYAPEGSGIRPQEGAENDDSLPNYSLAENDPGTPPAKPVNPTSKFPIGRDEAGRLILRPGKRCMTRWPTSCARARRRCA